MKFIFWFSIFALYYIYDGYLRLLVLVSALRRGEKAYEMPAPLPKVTVLITVFNEAIVIRKKIENVLSLRYPADRLDVLVASDGSTDSTDDIVMGVKDRRVRLFRSDVRAGKTATQNKAVAVAAGDIVVFTDAGTSFDKGFLRNIVVPFSDPEVGGVDGHLLFASSEGSGVSESQGFYWRYELRLREAESMLGILAVGSGACLAIRRSLFRQMDLNIGEDCTLPLDIIRQGYKMVHAPDAVACDRMENEPAGEFKTRVRMTLRNWQGTWKFPELLNPFLYPGYAFALWSHKVLRWLSPVFLICLTVSAAALAAGGSQFFKFVSIGFVGFYLIGLIGWQVEFMGLRVPVAKTVFSFLLANIGFFVGVVKAVGGYRVSRYR